MPTARETALNPLAPIHKPTPPANLNPSAFLSKLTSTSTHNLRSSTCTLKDELETLSNVKSRLAIVNAHANEPSQNANETVVKPRGSQSPLLEMKSRYEKNRRSYRSDANLEATECERALAYMNRYKGGKLGGKVSKLRNEWNSSTRVKRREVVGVVSNPPMTPRQQSGKSIQPLASTTIETALSESTIQMDESYDASVSSNASASDTHSLKSWSKTTTPGEAEVLGGESSNEALSDFKALSYSDIQCAPSLTCLSTVKPNHASSVTAVHLLVNCKGCTAPISASEASLSAMGFQWHPRCFKCANAQCGS
ncbi:hypothetical protein HDU98_010423 [Podochytrium sp. JEL0797]|nr:hypothetical protein HDU98_010423 [Podochytrium sp. JEL0797]